MPEATVGVRLHVEGADELRREMSELQASFQRGEISVQQFAAGSRGLNRDATTLIKSTQLQNRLFMAQHPTLNNLTKAMGTFGSASRGVLSITTALSTTILALNSAGREVNALNSELQEAKRQQALALSRYGFDSEEYAEATERVNELTAKIKEFNAQTTVSNINNVLNYAAAIGILGGSISQAIKAGTLGVGTLTLALSGLIAVPAGIAKAFSDIGSIASIFDMIMGTNFFNWMKKSMDQLFAGQIPDILKFAGQAFEKLFTVIIPDAFIRLINWWNKGNETLVNIFINAINDIIEKANTIASAIGLPKIKTMALYTAPQIALGSPAGTSSTTNGSASTPFAVVSRAGGGNQTLVVNNYISGSIISKNEFDKELDKSLKESLKRMGWN